MSNSIGGIGGFSSFASSIFSKIDTTGQGYISKSDLQSALDSASSSADSTSSVDELFTTLDANGDSKVTKDEFTQGLQQLASQLDSQYNSMRMGSNEGMPPPPSGGMPPPPPPGGSQQAGNDEGFTQDELSSMAENVSSTDSKLSSLFSTIADNFDAADTDGNGKVDHNEAMAYMQGQQGSTASSSSTGTATTSGSSTSGTSQDQVLAQLMELLRAYGTNDNSTSSLLSTLA